MTSHVYSDLEVAPSEAPQLVLNDNSPERMPYYSHKAEDHSVPEPTSKPLRTLWGLSPRKFWIILGISLFLIIGSIAGGVAGDIVSRNNNKSLSSQHEGEVTMSTSAPTSHPSSELPAATPTHTDSTPNLSTTTIVFPSATIARDCPSSNGTAYSVSYDDDEPLTFRKFCSAGFHHIVKYNDVVKVQTLSLNDCINACANFDQENKEGIFTGDTQICNAVCWRNNKQQGGPDRIPGFCFGYATWNYTDTEVELVEEEYCDSAVWINQRYLWNNQTT